MGSVNAFVELGAEWEHVKPLGSGSFGTVQVCTGTKLHRVQGSALSLILRDDACIRVSELALFRGCFEISSLMMNT